MPSTTPSGGRTEHRHPSSGVNLGPSARKHSSSFCILSNQAYFAIGPDMVPRGARCHAVPISRRQRLARRCRIPDLPGPCDAARADPGHGGGSVCPAQRARGDQPAATPDPTGRADGRPDRGADCRRRPRSRPRPRPWSPRLRRQIATCRAAPTRAERQRRASEPTTAPDDRPTSPTTTAEPSAPVAAPTIQSDLEDYPPGGLVTLTGANWQPGESVHIFVNDDFGSTWSRNVDVTADAVREHHGPVQPAELVCRHLLGCCDRAYIGHSHDFVYRRKCDHDPGRFPVSGPQTISAGGFFDFTASVSRGGPPGDPNPVIVGVTTTGVTGSVGCGLPVPLGCRSHGWWSCRRRSASRARAVKT